MPRGTIGKLVVETVERSPRASNDAVGGGRRVTLIAAFSTVRVRRYADYTLQNKMVKSAANAERFLEKACVQICVLTCA